MTAPIPTTEAVEALARALYGNACKGTYGASTWEELTAGQRYSINTTALELLADAYPQIVDDVLNHYADQLDMADLTGDVGMYVTWLIQQASQVRP